jgi:hypothetical protein
MLTYCKYLFYVISTSSIQVWNEIWNDLKQQFSVNLFLKPRYDIEAAKYVDVPLELHDTEFRKEE